MNAARIRQLGCQMARVLMPLGMVFGISAYSLRNAATDATAIKLPAQSHDFGPLQPFTTSEFTFDGKNPFSEVLTIDRIARSCGCTSAQCYPSVVPPGTAFYIKTALSTQAGDLDISSHVTVYGHCGHRQVIGSYRLFGSVQNLIVFPEEGGGFIRLGSWAPSQLPAQVRVSVERGGFPLDFDELRVACNSPAVSTSVRPLNGRSWQVFFSIASDDSTGTFGYPVIFRFARKGKLLPPRVVEQAYVELTGPFVALPPSVLFAVRPGQHVRKTITVARRSEATTISAPKIIAVSSSSNYLRATYAGNADPTVIKLDYSAPETSCTDHGEITIIVSEESRIYRIKVGFLAIIS